MQSLHVEMNAQSVSNSSFSMEQIQNHAVSLQSSEVYFSMNIKYAVVISTESTWKNNSEILHTAGIQCICGAMAQWTGKPDLLMYSQC